MNDIKLFKPYYQNEMSILVADIIQEGCIASGNYINAFETGLGGLLEGQRVVSTSNMSAAMTLALYLSGVKEGDEVISTSYACMATNSPIANLGAVPVWVDVVPDSIYMDPLALEKAITENTKAVILYHVAGYVGDLDVIADICKKHGIKLIEDCNNALLARHKGVLAGSFGDFSVYSFYPNRQINGLEGGALVCKLEDDYIQAKKLRKFGIDQENFRTTLGEINEYSDIPVAGWSFSFNNLSAAVACSQLTSVSERVAKTRENAKYLSRALSDIGTLKVVSENPDSESVYWVFFILTKRRERLLSYLNSLGIHASGLHFRNDKYSCFKNSHASLPNTENLQSEITALPCGWWLGKEDLDRIIYALENIDLTEGEE